MRNISTAEWILGLVTSRDRAATTVGDLVEDAPGSVLRFWAAVLRIAGAHLWRGVIEDPARMIRVAILGLAVDVGASLLFAGLSGVVFFVESWNGLPVRVNSMWRTIGLEAPTLLLAMWIGRRLARWAPGRELSACLAYAIAGSLFSFAMMLVAPGGLGPSALWGVFLGDAVRRLPVLAGAMWGRDPRVAAR
jgi:hypothetical protein